MGEMSEAGRQTIPPEEIGDVFRDKLEEVVEIASVTSRQFQIAEEDHEETGAALRDAAEAVDKANATVAGWRCIARLALGGSGEYPAERTLRAQMLINGKPNHEADVIVAHIAAINEYAASENPVVAVVQPAPRNQRGEEDRSWIYFLHLQTDDEAAPVATITRAGEEHYTDLSANHLYALNPDPQAYIKLHSNNKASDPLRVHKSVEDIVFAGTHAEVKRLFAEELNPDALVNGDQSAVPVAIIYGDEAVELFTNLLGNGMPSLRPALYGTMRSMEKSYSGVLGVYDPGEQQRVQEMFSADVKQYLLKITGDYSPERDQAYIDERYALLTPDIQKFVGFSDDELADSVKDFVRHHSIINTEGIVAKVTCGGNSLADIWAIIWNGLGKKGFDELAERMLSADFVLLEREILNREFQFQKNMKGRDARRSRARIQRALVFFTQP
jgi:hypothetical protein